MQRCTRPGCPRWASVVTVPAAAAAALNGLAYGCLRGRNWPADALTALSGMAARAAQALHAAKVAALASVVFVPAAAAMALNSLSARRFRERNWHTAVPTALTGIAFMLVPLGVRRGGPVAGIALIVVAAMGAWAVSGEHSPSSRASLDPGVLGCRMSKDTAPPFLYVPLVTPVQLQPPADAVHGVICVHNSPNSRDFEP